MILKSRNFEFSKLNKPHRLYVQATKNDLEKF